jgi:hypothetical protein
MGWRVWMLILHSIALEDEKNFRIGSFRPVDLLPEVVLRDSI